MGSSDGFGPGSTCVAGCGRSVGDCAAAEVIRARVASEASGTRKVISGWNVDGDWLDRRGRWIVPETARIVQALFVIPSAARNLLLLFPRPGPTLWLLV
jgi:hypothetical protein